MKYLINEITWIMLIYGQLLNEILFQKIIFSTIQISIKIFHKKSIDILNSGLNIT